MTGFVVQGHVWIKWVNTSLLRRLLLYDEYMINYTCCFILGSLFTYKHWLVQHINIDQYTYITYGKQKPNLVV